MNRFPDPAAFSRVPLGPLPLLEVEEVKQQTRKVKMNYKARWSRNGIISEGNVSFTARSDAEAKRKADKIAREIGLPNTPRTLMRESTTIEVLSTGVTTP
jgi:hypothetical protein